MSLPVCDFQLIYFRLAHILAASSPPPAAECPGVPQGEGRGGGRGLQGLGRPAPRPPPCPGTSRGLASNTNQAIFALSNSHFIKHTDLRVYELPRSGTCTCCGTWGWPTSGWSSRWATSSYVFTFKGHLLFYKFHVLCVRWLGT